MIACLCTFIGNTNRNPLVQFKETKNKWDLLAREVVVWAQISSYWAHGWLEVPEIKWVRTNNYKFHTFRSVRFDPGLSPRPSFRFSKGLVPRLPPTPAEAVPATHNGAEFETYTEQPYSEAIIIGSGINSKQSSC